MSCPESCDVRLIFLLTFFLGPSNYYNDNNTSFVYLQKIISYLKIDIEGWEKPALEQIVTTNVLQNVMQLVFEIHLFWYDILGVYDFFSILFEVEQLGFRRYHYHRNPDCVRVSQNTGLNRSMCHELFYVNVNFLT